MPFIEGTFTAAWQESAVVVATGPSKSYLVDVSAGPSVTMAAMLQYAGSTSWFRHEINLLGDTATIPSLNTGDSIKIVCEYLPASATAKYGLNVVADAAGVGGGSASTMGTTLALAGFQKITDGTSVAAVKPASSAAVADDPAVVVAISPSSRLQSDGAVVPGTVATASGLAGMQYNTALPAMANLQQVALQADSQGRLIVNPRARHVIGPAGLSALNTDLITGTVNGWFDAENARSIGIQLIGSAGITGGGAILEQTSDPILAPAGVVLPFFEPATLSPPSNNGIGIAANSMRLVAANLTARYIRARLSAAMVGGTAQAVLLLSPQVGPAYGNGISFGTNSIGNVGVVGSAQPSANLVVAEIASSALTVTTTSASIAPTWAATHIVQLAVTAVSGTTPTLDCVVQDSINGSWVDLYTFPRVTGPTTIQSPPLAMRGTALRYVQTVGGTAPSFTRAISRVPSVAAVPASPPTAGAMTSVAAASANTLILAVNPFRKGGYVFNESTSILRLGLSNAAVSATSYTVQVAASGFYELPSTPGGCYTGEVRGFWDTAIGSARVTEMG